jgi:hypothetical protein
MSEFTITIFMDLVMLSLFRPLEYCVGRPMFRRLIELYVNIFFGIRLSFILRMVHECLHSDLDYIISLLKLEYLVLP